MWRGLYHDHFLLGAQKDTMPRRKWLRLVTSAFIASILAKEAKGKVSPTPIIAPDEIEASAPESREGSYRLIKIPIVAYSGQRPNITLTLFYNSGSASSLQPFGYGWTHSFNWKIQQDSQGNAILIRDTGRKHLYTYDPNSGSFIPPSGIYDELIRHPDGTWTLTFKNQTKMNFDNSGRLVSIVDRNGKQANLSYDANGRLIRVQEESGEILFSFGYQGTDTKIRTVTDLIGGVCRFSYDACGNLVSITDPLGYVRNFAYDSYHRIASIAE
ncbi:MAG: DUF6531 domain-containing protein [Armatimonadota bacterium]